MQALAAYMQALAAYMHALAAYMQALAAYMQALAAYMQAVATFRVAAHGTPPWVAWLHICWPWLHICRLWMHICRLWLHICKPLAAYMQALAAYMQAVATLRVAAHGTPPWVAWLHICSQRHICRPWLHICSPWLHICRPWLHICKLWPPSELHPLAPPRTPQGGYCQDPLVAAHGTPPGGDFSGWCTPWPVIRQGSHRLHIQLQVEPWLHICRLWPPSE